MAEFANLVAPLARVAVEALLNTLWQGACLALLAWLVLRMVPASNAATRYAVWYAVLLAVFSLPFLNAGARLLRPLPATVETAAMIALPDVPSVKGPEPLQPQSPIIVPGGTTVSVAFLGWLVVVLVMGARLAWDYRRLLQLKRGSAVLDGFDATPWTRRPVELRNSGSLEAPAMAGFVRPAILFPRELTGRLTHEDTRQVLLHELAHVRRWDDWTNLGQKIAEAVLFFHPPARWIGKRLALEREIACDDWVVSVSGSPRPYADCLARLAEIISTGAKPSPVLSSTGERKQIFRRVEMILNRNRNAKPALSKSVFAAALAICLGATWLLARTSPLLEVAEPPAQGGEATAKEQPKEMRAYEEEVRKLAEEIRKQVEEQIRPKTAEIEALAEQVQAHVERSIQPHTEEIEKLAEQFRKDHEGTVPDEAAARKLEEKVRAHEEAMRLKEKELRALEEKIRRIESDSIRKAEARVRELEAKISRMEAQMRARQEQLRKMERETVSPAPPAPPAPPAQSASPAPPAPPLPPAPSAVHR